MANVEFVGDSKFAEMIPALLPPSQKRNNKTAPALLTPKFNGKKLNTTDSSNSLPMVKVDTSDGSSEMDRGNDMPDVGTSSPLRSTSAPVYERPEETSHSQEQLELILSPKELSEKWIK